MCLGVTSYLPASEHYKDPSQPDFILYKVDILTSISHQKLTCAVCDIIK